MNLTDIQSSIYQLFQFKLDDICGIRKLDVVFYGLFESEDLISYLRALLNQILS